MGYTWTASKKIRLMILNYVEQNSRVTARQVGEHLAKFGYQRAVAYWHLSRMAKDGLLTKVGGPTYYEVADATEAQ
jgi:hypothetical protein